MVFYQLTGEYYVKFLKEKLSKLRCFVLRCFVGSGRSVGWNKGVWRGRKGRKGFTQIGADSRRYWFEGMPDGVVLGGVEGLDSADFYAYRFCSNDFW